jgi:hypothetical protein
MPGTLIAAVAVAASLLLALLAALWRNRRARRGAPGAVIAEAGSSTSLDDSTGAVRSIQTAEVLLPSEALEELWSSTNLERLARTYWRFLTRATLGVIQIRYSEHERSVVLLFRPFRLLTFHAPEYEMEPLRGLVRWRIARGLLVARRGRDGGGYLQIEVRREPVESGVQARLHVAVEVANFYPSISGISRRIYDMTQSRIHVVVTSRFIRSLVRLDLAESRVGRFRI